MSTIPPRHADGKPPELEDEAAEPEFKPLTADEARALRERHPPLSPWSVIAVQAVAGLLVALLAWLVSGRAQVAWSAGYGALAVIAPAAVFARGLVRQMAAPRAGAALAGLFVWELVKILLTVAMLWVAPRLIAQLSWLALLAGFVVTLKVYWVAIWLRPGRGRPSRKI